jgi:hypothetical protein
VGTECGGDDVAAGGRLGTPWRAGKGIKEGNRAGFGEGRHVEGGEAGGGAVTTAERRPGGELCAGGRGGQSRARARGRRRERGVQGTCLEFSRISGTSR